MTEHDCCPKCGYSARKLIPVTFALDHPNEKRPGFRCANPNCGFLFMESRCNNYGYIKFAPDQTTFVEIRRLK